MDWWRGWPKNLLGLDVKLPLPRMTYDEAMERFGHDAPDLRFGLEIVDVTDLAGQSRIPRLSRRGRRWESAFAA